MSNNLFVYFAKILGYSESYRRIVSLSRILSSPEYLAELENGRTNIVQICHMRVRLGPGEYRYATLADIAEFLGE